MHNLTPAVVLDDAPPARYLPAEEVLAIAAADELAERVRKLAHAQLRPALNSELVYAEGQECRDLLRTLASWVEEVTL